MIYEASPHTLEIINQTIDYSGLSAPIKTYAANVDDIGIALIYNGKRLILVNELLFTELQKSKSDYWLKISVIAHEIGHHLNGHTILNENEHPIGGMNWMQIIFPDTSYTRWVLRFMKQQEQ